MTRHSPANPPNSPAQGRGATHGAKPAKRGVERKTAGAPKYPIQPLAQRLGYGDLTGRSILNEANTERRNELCQRIGINPKRLAWMIDPRNPNGGLDPWEADRAATAAGTHPRQIWPDWQLWLPDDDTDE